MKHNLSQSWGGYGRLNPASTYIIWTKLWLGFDEASVHSGSHKQVFHASSVLDSFGNFKVLFLPIPTHHSYIHVRLTDGNARIFCDSSLFASPMTWRDNSHCEREWTQWGDKERGRRRKKPWPGFEPTNSVSRAERSNHYVHFKVGLSDFEVVTRWNPWAKSPLTFSSSVAGSSNPGLTKMVSSLVVVDVGDEVADDDAARGIDVDVAQQNVSTPVLRDSLLRIPSRFFAYWRKDTIGSFSF